MSLPKFKLLTSPSTKPAEANYDPNAAPNMAAGWVAEGGGIKDAVGDLDAAPQGVTVADSPYGAALDFGGKNSVGLGDLPLADPYTLFVLMQTGSAPGGWVFHRGEVDGIGWQVTEATAFPAATVGGAVHANLIPFSQGADTWYAVALVVNKGKGRLYVNAQLVCEFDSAALSGSGDWTLGDGSFSGAIADARIYNRALPVRELETIQGGPFQWSAYGRDSTGPRPEPDLTGTRHRRIKGGQRRNSRLKVKATRM